MSWYTYIYPTEGFSLDEPVEKIKERIDKKKEKLSEIWAYINGLCVASPDTLTKEDPIVFATKTMIEYFDNYVKISKEEDYEWFHVEILDNKKWWEESPPEEGEDTEYRPFITYNHFPYSSDPEDGIRSSMKDIEYIRKRLVNYACSSPKDIIINDVDSDDYIKDASLYVTQELEELKDWLDETIYELCFSEMLSKYYDTHEEN